MKKSISYVIIIFLLSACGSNKSDQPVTEEDTTAEITFSWQASLNDSTGRLEMNKTESMGPDSLNESSVVRFINENNPQIKLEWLKNSQDTVYLKITDAHYLTQQMGSTGSTMYLASVVYNLTEIPGIRYVNLDFEEGDHAAPGTFSRESFRDE